MWGCTQRDMFLGDWFLIKQVSINALWWLAFAITIRADFSLLPLDSMKGSPSYSYSIGIWEFCLGVVSCIVLFRIPDKFMA